MTDKADILNILRLHLPFIHSRSFVKDIGIFGSYIRQDQHETSDIDMLVEIEEEYDDLFTFIRLREYLEDIFRLRIDLVMKQGIKPVIREKILKEAVYV